MRPTETQSRSTRSAYDASTGRRLLLYERADRFAEVRFTSARSSDANRPTPDPFALCLEPRTRRHKWLSSIRVAGLQTVGVELRRLFEARAAVLFEGIGTLTDRGR